MAATIHHPNIDVMTYARGGGHPRQRRNGNGGNGNGPVGYHAKIKQKAKFVDEAACTGCRQCEMACNVAVPDEFNADMVSRRAAYIAFPQAVPKKAVISAPGRLALLLRVPGRHQGARLRGYACAAASTTKRSIWCWRRRRSSARSGAPATLPCEGECTRGELEGPVPIRRLKRFIADERYGQAEPKAVEKPEQNGKKVAIVGSARPASPPPGSSRARATASRSTSRPPLPGGSWRSASPPIACPNDVIDDDIANVTAIGVEIATDARVDDPATLKYDGLRRRSRGDGHA